MLSVTYGSIPFNCLRTGHGQILKDNFQTAYQFTIDMEYKRMDDFALSHFELYWNKHFKLQNEPADDPHLQPNSKLCK